MAIISESVLERINSEAKEVRIGRAVLTFIAALLFGLGWLTARLFAIIWLVCAWSFTAVKVGWREGRGTGTGGSSDGAQIERLRKRIQ